MNGIINLDSLQWETPKVIDIPENEKDAISYYSKKEIRSKIKGAFG
jgi:hypothetical protein